MGKHAMGTKAVCYVWWVWSHLEEAPVRAGGLGGAGSQEEWQSRAKGINHFNGQGQIWCCLCWASQGEEELNKRKKQLCPPVVLSTERVPTYPCPFSKGFFMPPFMGMVGTHSSILKSFEFFGETIFPGKAFFGGQFWSLLILLVL